MRIIPCLEALETLKDKQLANFIREKSPWLSSDGWSAEDGGYTFVLSSLDAVLMQRLCIVPHIPFDNTEYREIMTIEFSSFDTWEYANKDEATGYYQAVAVVGSVFGANIFMSEDFVASIPGLKQRLEKLLEGHHVE